MCECREFTSEAPDKLTVLRPETRKCLLKADTMNEGRENREVEGHIISERVCCRERAGREEQERRESGTVINRE